MTRSRFIGGVEFTDDHRRMITRCWSCSADTHGDSWTHATATGRVLTCFAEYCMARGRSAYNAATAVGGLR